MNQPNNDSKVLQARIERLEAREQQRAKRTRRFIALGIACALATPFAVRALGAVPHVFSSGDRIVAADINANFAHVVGGVTAVEARTAALEARPTGLYCGSASSNGAFMSGTLRGYAAARELCRTACGASPTAHLCTVSEAFTSLQLGLLPGDTSGWITRASYGDSACGGGGTPDWSRSLNGVNGLVFDTRAPVGAALDVAGCDIVRPLFCCE